MCRSKKPDVTQTNPELILEFDREKNGMKQLSDFTHGSHESLYWRCMICNGSYRMEIRHKCRGGKCKHCIKNSKGPNVSITHPHLILEFDNERNEDKKLSNYTHGSNELLFWLCQICTESYAMKIYKKTIGIGCTYCASKKIGRFNNFEYKFPEKSKEWSSKNILKANEVFPNDTNLYKWNCPKCTEEYDMSISCRTNNGYGCPFCAGQRVSDKNNLEFLRPDLCEEWDYNNNDGRLPSEFTIGSSTYLAGWKCKICFHGWKTSIYARTRVNGTGCSRCANVNNSKGEKNITQLFDKNTIKYEPQKRFKELGQLSYDFYLPTQKLLMEFDGIQHFDPNNYFCKKNKDNFKTQITNDLKKSLFCLKNGYKLLRIPYIHLNNVEEILDDYLNKLDNSIIYCHIDGLEGIPLEIYNKHSSLTKDSQINDIVEDILLMIQNNTSNKIIKPREPRKSRKNNKQNNNDNIINIVKNMQEKSQEIYKLMLDLQQQILNLTKNEL